MKKIIIPFILAFFIASAVQGQTDYRGGKVFTLNHDTLVGKIDFKGDMNNSLRCDFLSGTNESKTYYPNDILGYRFTNGKYYVTRFLKTEDGGRLIFVEYLIAGHKNLFYFRDMAGNHFLIDNGKDTVIEMPYKETTIDVDGRLFLQESKTHIGLLKAYFSDCPKLFNEIDNFGKPDFNNLISITKEYHHLTCGDSGCIVYYQSKPRFSISLEPRVGLIHFKSTSGYVNQLGGLVYFWLPRANENVYAKTGFYYLSDFYTTATAVKIPVQLEYLYPYRTIKPKFDFGVNAYFLNEQNVVHQNLLMLAMAAGVLVRITGAIYLDVDLESDLFQFSTNSKFFYSHSVNAGLYIKL